LQAHSKVSSLSVQVAPFLHGDDSHGLTIRREIPESGEFYDEYGEHYGEYYGE
jgi:hypothetical protein